MIQTIPASSTHEPLDFDPGYTDDPNNPGEPHEPLDPNDPIHG